MTEGQKMMPLRDRVKVTTTRGLIMTGRRTREGLILAHRMIAEVADPGKTKVPLQPTKELTNTHYHRGFRNVRMWSPRKGPRDGRRLTEKRGNRRGRMRVARDRRGTLPQFPKQTANTTMAPAVGAFRTIDTSRIQVMREDHLRTAPTWSSGTLVTCAWPNTGKIKG